MSSSSTSNTIYVGNIQPIPDDQIREYFQRFGKIEACYHNCTRAADEWLIDYRFIKFSSDTDMSILLTNKIDHIICRNRLDIHPYEAAFRDETRLVSDRKICIAHTDPKLNRNLVKKAFSKYGRVLNCNCTSSGNGLEYTYIEFECINPIQAICASGKRHYAGRTSLAVKQPIRPSQCGTVKIEPTSIDEKIPKDQSHRRRLDSNVEPSQYSSFSDNHHNRRIEKELHSSSSSNLRPISNSPCESQFKFPISSNTQQTKNNNSNRTNNETPPTCSQEELKDFENEYDLIIQQDFDEITCCVDRFLRRQKESYVKLRNYILKELQSQTSSSSSDEGEIHSTSSSSDSENKRHRHKKRVKSRN